MQEKPKKPKKDDGFVIKESFKSFDEKSIKKNIQTAVNSYLQAILKQ